MRFLHSLRWLILLCLSKDSATSFLPTFPKEHQHFKQHLATSESLPHFFAGLAAGSLECIVGHPLETVRIMSMTSKGKGLSPLQLLLQSLSERGGLLTLYRGSVSELLSNALTSAYVYGANDFLKRLIGKSIDDDDFEKVDAKLLISAGATGCLDVAMTKPFEMIKLRQQASTSSLAHASFMERASTIFAENGLLGLYRGWLPTLLRESLGSLAFFAVYQQSKNHLVSMFHEINANRLLLKINNVKARKHYDMENKEVSKTSSTDALQLLEITSKYSQAKLSFLQSNFVVLAAGGMAGLAYILISHPLDVISVYMQIDLPTRVVMNQVSTNTLSSRLPHFLRKLMSPSSTSSALASNMIIRNQYHFKNTLHCVSEVVAKQGVSGLFQGVGSAAVRSVPTFAASFWGYECCLAYFAKIQIKSS